MSEVITYYGGEKTGKTSLGFSAIRAFKDGILVHFDFDMGRERAIYRFEDVADRIKSVLFPEVPKWTLGSGAITQRYAHFEQTYEMALNDPQVKVVFIDTATQMRNLDADEYLENYVKRNNPKRSQLQQIEYRMPNSRVRAKIMAAKDAGKLLIMSHYEQPIYVEQIVQRPDGSMVKESVNTGEKTFAGLADTPYLADYHLLLFLKDYNLDLVTNKPIGPRPQLKTVGRILTPHPRDAYMMEVPDITYERLKMVLDGIMKASGV